MPYLPRLVLVLSLLTLPAGADDFSLDVFPRFPRPEDVVSVHLSGDVDRQCGPFFDQLTRQGNVFRLRTVRNESCGSCADATTLYSSSHALNTLDPGDYEVKLTELDGCSGEVTVVDTLAFRVAPRIAGCDLGPGPAATLVVPYFEVDLEDPEGRTTLFSVGNASPFPTLANLVIWTDLGLPALALPFRIPGNGLQSFDLRRILTEGRLPPAPAGPGCTPRGDLSAAELEILAAQLTGRPHPEDGLCYGNDRGEPSVAAGFVTIDVIDHCPAAGMETSVDLGYFGPDGPGSVENLLWGDVFYVDPSRSSAFGIRAVPLAARPELFGPGAPFESEGRPGSRLPLPVRYRSRYLQGGPFTGGTSFLVWVRPPIVEQPVDCSIGPDRAFNALLILAARDERGRLVDYLSTPIGQATRIELGEGDLAVSQPFGQIDLTPVLTCGVCSPPFSDPLESWVIPILEAEGRFSVAMEAQAIERHCPTFF